MGGFISKNNNLLSFIFIEHNYHMFYLATNAPTTYYSKLDYWTLT